MSSSTAYSAVTALRTAYRRLWRGAAISGGAALGLLPLIYVLSVPGWQRGLLVGGCLLYLLCKSYRLRNAWQTVRQLRLEGGFIGHSFNGYQLRRCLQRRGHLWTHSYTVRALRRLMARPLPNLLRTDKKRQRVRGEYDRSLAGMCPSRFSLGLPLGLLLVGATFASVAGQAGTLATWPLRAGAASALVLLGAEVVQAVCRYRARHLFRRLVEALADWTLARSVHELLHQRQATSYQHTPLYRAPAWFAPQAPARPATSSGASDHASSQRHAA